MATLTWTTAGESHGPALIGVLEGLPAGMELSTERIDAELARRWRGYGRGGRAKLETDRVEVLAGVRAGRTLGSPLCLRLANRDDSIETLPVPSNPRPGHADLAGCQKFTHRDPRAILERASARETAMRVALAGAARQLIEAFGVEVFAHTVELGGVAAAADAYERAGDGRQRLRERSEFLGVDPTCEEPWKRRVDEALEALDTLGGLFEVVATGVPPGLGSHASGPERLTGRLAGALLSIPAMKGVEFGLGFESARRPGSEVHDAIELRGPDADGYGRFRRRTNRAGGLEGGMTTGEPLVARVAMKPIPTLRRGLDTVDFETGETVRATYQRSDVTSVPAASVVGEAMVALELARSFRDKFGGDSLDQVRDNFEAWRRRVEEV
ncbi:chorismate synthase [Engelhardtia mirabilis]|uniref:Chorismate synthase n=1 Tax=Engelhardtia mirabilis TaxID=2528011 RepID=A0A518BPE5_9BACT|nr:Chorismate synthase [Planctomycetes bacterium Pla133]QDV03181.1 Chorismate synthase [Planctomycetes bacterium Pla86]